MLTEFETLRRHSQNDRPEASSGTRAKSGARRLEEFEQNNRIFARALRTSGYQTEPAGPCPGACPAPTPTKRTS